MKTEIPLSYGQVLIPTCSLVSPVVGPHFEVHLLPQLGDWLHTKAFLASVLTQQHMPQRLYSEQRLPELYIFCPASASKNLACL